LHSLEGIIAQFDNHVAAEIDLDNAAEITKSVTGKLMEFSMLEYDYAQILQIAQQMIGYVVEAVELTHRKRQFFELGLRFKIIPHGIGPLELAQYQATDDTGIMQAVVAIAIDRCLLAQNVADVHLLRLLNVFLFIARLRHRQT